LGYPDPATMLWPLIALLGCLTPIVLWRHDVRRTRRRLELPQARTPEYAGDITRELPADVLAQHLGTNLPKPPRVNGYPPAGRAATTPPPRRHPVPRPPTSSASPTLPPGVAPVRGRAQRTAPGWDHPRP
ncbi:MAG TPA: hypothetical protein VJT31_12895, partial [Rugosimonospora sp.]|nr:hypothetical protein [Rugosimonospora sp.]